MIMQRIGNMAFVAVASWAVVMMMVMVGSLGADGARLSTNFYWKTCPGLEFIVAGVVKAAIAKEKRMGASLLRLHFHDCFVQGCDGSILLDGNDTEKTAPPNNNSLRGFHVIDKIKRAVEAACPKVVSCADIVAIAARDSTHFLGGPFWNVELGRRDSLKPGTQSELQGLPPAESTVSTQIQLFAKQGLSVTDLVALAGTHTIGQARCIKFRSRIYNNASIDPSFAKLRRRSCPATSGNGDDNLAPLDLRTPNLFDNHYFVNLVEKEGLMPSDQNLYNGSSSSSSAATATAGLVRRYAASERLFFRDMVKAMLKMGRLNVLRGRQGQIRSNCRTPN